MGFGVRVWDLGFGVWGQWNVQADTVSAEQVAAGSTVFGVAVRHSMQGPERRFFCGLGALGFREPETLNPKPSLNLDPGVHHLGTWTLRVR